MGNSNTLMFKVGIADIKAELDKHKKEIESWVNSNPIKLKVQLEDSSLEQLAAKLKAMGATFGESNEEIKKMKEELNALRTILDAVMNGTGSKESAATNELRVMTRGAETAVQAMNQLSTVVNETMSRAGSGKGFLYLDRVPAIYSKLMFDIENRMTAIGHIMSKGNLPSWLDNGQGRGYMNNVFADYERLLKTMQNFKEKGFIDFHNVLALKDVFRGLESAYGPIIKQAGEYNKQVEKQASDVAKYEQQKVESIRKAEEKGEKERAAARAKEEKDYEKVWQNGMKMREKADKEYMKEVEKFTEQSKKAYAQAEKEKEKAAKERAAAVETAEKKVQAEIKKTESLQKKIKQSITRGEAAGRDMSSLHAQNAALEQQLRLMESLKNSLHRGTTNPKSDIIEKRIKETQTLREDTDLLRKSEEKLNQVREQANKRNDNQRLKDLENEAKSVNDAYKKYEELRNKLIELHGLSSRAITAGVDRSNLEAYIKDLNTIREIMKEIFSNNGRTVLSGNLASFKLQSGMLAKDVLGNANITAVNSTGKRVLKFFMEELRAAERQMHSADTTAQNLGKHIDNLEAKKLNFKNADFSELDTAIGKIRAIQNELANFAKYGYSAHGNTANEIIKNMGLAGANEEARIALNNLTTGKREAERANKELSDSEQRLANAIKGTSDSMRGQSQILSDLKMMAMQYLSVWGAQSFLNNIIETGGQLEQQRLSLSAILGDIEKANTLFGQVKELALKSPFGVVQIDQMTKQLAAYSFEYEDLFDWTKRLADISAATGTSVDRLALALGHVRSEGALSGYTLRQFAMANVPVLRMLSENLGISSKEVRERVRKKEIGADDVQEILKQLTDEGGMFYNAQEVMSQALNAKFKNLRDAFDIMYGEIAESGVGDRLKDLATILTQGAKEWERFGKDILMVGAAFGVGRTAMLLFNTALGENTASTLKSIAAAQQKENAHLRLARAAGIVTKAEYEQLVYNERYSVSGLKVALIEKNLTIEELQRAVALGKVNKAVAQAAVVAAGYDAALISNVRVLGFWRKGLFLLVEGFRAATIAVKGFMASVWPLLALSTVFDLVNRTSQSNDAAVEAAENAAKATNKYQDLQAMTERLGTSQNKTTDQLENNIKAMKDGLIAVGKYTDELKKQVESVESLAEKYDILYAAMKKVSDEASDKQSRKQNLIQEGLSVGSGTAWNPLNWFRDNALKDAKDIDDYTSDLYLALDKNDRVLRDGFKKILGTKQMWQKKFESMSARDIFMSLDESVQDDILYNLRWINSDKSTNKAAVAVAEALYGGVGGRELKNYSGYSYKGAIDELRSHKEELTKAFEDAFHVDYPEIDLSNASPEQKVIFAKWLDTTIANLNDVKEAGKKALNDIVIEGTISVRPLYSLDNENWEKFLTDFKEKNPLAYYEWNKHESTGALTEEQKRKSLESYGRTFSGTTQNNIGNEAKKQIKELQKERKNLEAFEKSIVYSESEESRRSTEQRKKEIDEQIKRLKQAQKDYNQYGDPDNNKGGSNEDKEAKALRERVRILKEAESAFQYWRKAVGDAASVTHVNEEFGKILSEQGYSFEDIENYKQTLEELRAKYQGIYDASEKAGKKRPQLLEAIKEIDKVLADIGRKDFERDTERFLSKTQIQLDNLTRRWEMFNSVREATGDVKLAIELSGADYAEGQTRNLADSVKQKIEEEFAAVGAVQIPFDIYLSDKEIEDSIKAAMPQANETQIKAFVEDYKKWRDLQRDVQKNDTSVFLKAFENEYDRKQQFDKIVSQYEESKQSLDNLLSQWLSGAVDTNGNRLGITNEQYNRAFGYLTAQANWEKFKAENDFKWVFDNIGTTSLETIKKMVKAMREYAKTTEMSEKETKAWHEAMDKLLDQESVLNPLNSIADAVKSYNDAVVNRKNAEEALRVSKMSRVERRRNGIDESTVIPLQQAQDDYREALSNEEKALLRVTKAIRTFASQVGELGSALSKLGSSIGGEFGDIMNGVGGMLDDLSSGMNSAAQLAETMKTKGLSGTIGKVTATIGIINSIVDFNKKLDSMLPNSESIYQKYADRQRKINELQEQIADYQIEALKRQIESTNWLYTNGLSELRNQGYVKQNLLKEYANSMLRPQEIYQNARSGLSKWAPAIIGAIVAVVGAVLTLGIGSIGSAALGATIAGALGTTATAAVGAALAAGAGAAIGTALRSAADQVFYEDGQTSARGNMRVQTRHSSFWRGEKTQNLEEWVRENYGKDLFDKNHYDLIDIELAKKLLEDGPTLVGETRETLERMVEYAEKIREIEDGVKDYVSQMFSPLVDNMTDALWDWLDTGKDILDSFEDYASDTFKNIAKDAVKSFLKINLIDKYQEKLNDIYTAYSLGLYNEQQLGLAVASVAGEIKTSLESLSPALQVLGETLENAFDIQGYDIVNGGNSSSSASATIKGITEQTWDLGISYWNAIRADVSINRAMIEQYFPLFYTSITSGNTKLQNIENNTAAIMRSNDEIRRIVDDVYSLFNGLRNKAWRMPIA